MLDHDPTYKLRECFKIAVTLTLWILVAIGCVVKPNKTIGLPEMLGCAPTYQLIRNI